MEKKMRMVNHMRFSEATFFREPYAFVQVYQTQHKTARTRAMQMFNGQLQKIKSCQ